MNKLVFATNNRHKLTEIRAIIPHGFDVSGLQEIGCTEDIIESSDTLEGNADIKSMFVYKQYGYDCFADDTGLEVESLDGKPGVFSARYAGEEGDADKNIEKLLLELTGVTNRKARFRTVISLVMKGEIRHFEGIVNGSITHERRGKDGFGYDPVFLPDNYSQTFAEMPLDIKNSISHRGKAMRKLIAYLKSI
jgi:XTP/dITP diphosphohydrolase